MSKYNSYIIVLRCVFVALCCIVLHIMCMLLVAYGGTAVDKWYSSEQKALSQLKNLTIVAVSPADTAELAKLCDRTMQLQCTINEGQIWFGNAAQSVQVQLQFIQQSNPALLASE